MGVGSYIFGSVSGTWSTQPSMYVSTRCGRNSPKFPAMFILHSSFAGRNVELGRMCRFAVCVRSSFYPQAMSPSFSDFVFSLFAMWLVVSRWVFLGCWWGLGWSAHRVGEETCVVVLELLFLGGGGAVVRM